VHAATQQKKKKPLEQPERFAWIAIATVELMPVEFLLCWVKSMACSGGKCLNQFNHPLLCSGGKCLNHITDLIHLLHCIALH
jgi:hypothetical protein